MPKAQNVRATRRRRKRTLDRAKGYFGNKSRIYRYAKDAVDRAGVYAYRDRKKKKSEFRKLWIVRINAACKQNDINYSRFMHGLSKVGIELDRKQLSELAINNEEAFKQLVAKAREGLELADKAE